jgi:hypothetical protein
MTNGRATTINYKIESQITNLRPQSSNHICVCVLQRRQEIKESRAISKLSDNARLHTSRENHNSLDRRVDVAPFRVHRAGACHVHKPGDQGFAE